MSIIVRKVTEEEKRYMEQKEVWESEIAQFDYKYENDETCVIEKGSAEIMCGNQKVILSEGDLAYFPKGTVCMWKVLSPMRKYLR